jgi:hypothetical protein
MQASNAMSHVFLDFILSQVLLARLEGPELASFLVPFQDFTVFSVVHDY